jgi:hypothetical protein
MQGIRPSIPFFGTPLGVKPSAPLQWNGLFPSPLFLLNPPNIGDKAKSVEPTITGSPTLIGDERGQALSFSGSGQYLSYPGSESGEYSGSLTVVAIWRRNAAESGFGSLFAKRAANCEIGCNYWTGGGFFQWYYSSGGGYQVYNLGATAPAIGIWTTTVFVRQNGAYLAVWQDGSLLGKDTSKTATPDSFSGTFDIAMDSGGIEVAPADVALFYIIPMAVEDADAAMLSVHPLAPFSPAPMAIIGRVNSSSDITIALTGASVAVSAGILTTSRNVPVSGAAVTTATGAVTLARSINLSGAQSTVSGGILGVGYSVALSGSAVVSAQGSVGFQPGIALIGNAITVSAGSVGVDHTVALSGASTPISAGNILSDRDIPLTGAAVTVLSGVIGGQGQQEVPEERRGEARWRHFRIMP